MAADDHTVPSSDEGSPIAQATTEALEYSTASSDKHWTSSRSPKRLELDIALLNSTEQCASIGIPRTPVDRILANTGGRYEDWIYHHSRLDPNEWDLSDDMLKLVLSYKFTVQKPGYSISTSSNEGKAYKTCPRYLFLGKETTLRDNVRLPDAISQGRRHSAPDLDIHYESDLSTGRWHRNEDIERSDYGPSSEGKRASASRTAPRPGMPLYVEPSPRHAPDNDRSNRGKAHGKKPTV